MLDFSFACPQMTEGPGKYNAAASSAATAALIGAGSGSPNHGQRWRDFGGFPGFFCRRRVSSHSRCSSVPSSPSSPTSHKCKKAVARALAEQKSGAGAVYSRALPSDDALVNTSTALVTKEEAVATGAQDCLAGLSDEETWAKGDVVRIVDGIGRGSEAVITEASSSHCTAVLIDEKRSKGSGQVWPSYHQVESVSTAWRLGRQVVLNGLSSKKLKHLNGLRGVVAKHPRESHPAFVTKKPAAGASQAPEPELRIVVRMADPQAAGCATVLVEARHAVSLEAHAVQMIGKELGLLQTEAENTTLAGA